jgi:hypothetical protein
LIIDFKCSRTKAPPMRLLRMTLESNVGSCGLKSGRGEAENWTGLRGMKHLLLIGSDAIS